MSKDLALQQTEWDLHENTNLVPLEFTEEIKPDLFGLETTKANEMVSGLSITLAEREVLRKEYLAHFRSHFKSRLENIKVVSPEEYEQEMKNKKN